MESIAIGQAAVTASGINDSLINRFIDFVDRPGRTAETYLCNLKQFIAYLNYAGVVQPVRQDVINYRQYLLSEHPAIAYAPNTAQGYIYRLDTSGSRYTVICKPSTAAQYLRAVGQLFSWTASEGIYPDIAANIHTPKVSRNHAKDNLTKQEVSSIEKHITLAAADKINAAKTATKDTAGRIDRATEQGKRLYAMYLLAVNAGLRTVELSRANIRDIEVKGDKAYIYIYGKGCSCAEQKKPIARDVYKALHSYLQSRTDNPGKNSPLFVSTGNRAKGKRIAARTIGAMLKKAMVEAGYNSERLTAHSLRHTAGTAVMEITGNNLYLTQHYMRHQNPATTETYLHNDTEMQETETAEKLFTYFHDTQ